MKDLKELLEAPALLSQRAIRSIRSEVSRVQLCGEPGIEIGGQILRPDKFTAYIEFFLSHAFPVTTCDGTAIHPQVVANSYRSMLHKVFDFNHMMRAYPGGGKQDRMLGTIVAVEFPYRESDQLSVNSNQWTVQGDKAKAPGIRAVAALHKQADGVPKVLEEWFSGKTDWTVSMEQEWLPGDAGFLIDDKLESKDAIMEQWRNEGTPQDLLDLGYVYCPASDAPTELFRCLDPVESKIAKKFKGRDVIILFGGLDGTVMYHGTGITWLGKEAEASVGQMLASKIKGEPRTSNLEQPTSIEDLIRRTAQLE